MLHAIEFSPIQDFALYCMIRQEDSFLSMIYERLKLINNLMSENGSIYIFKPEINSFRNFVKN